MPGRGRPRKQTTATAAVAASKKVAVTRSSSKHADTDITPSTTSDVTVTTKKIIRGRDAASTSKDVGHSANSTSTRRRIVGSATPTPEKARPPREDTPIKMSKEAEVTPSSRNTRAATSSTSKGRDNAASVAVPENEKTPPRPASISSLPSPTPFSQNSQQSLASSSSSGRSSAEAIMNALSTHPNLPTAELIKKLKTVSSEFQSMKQQEVEGDYFELVPFCLHLAGTEFFQHSSPDVRILVACCLADILRIFAPKAPFEEPNQIKSIFKFLIAQLQGIKNPRGIAFTRYFYLLENLSFVKCFALCFQLDDEDAQEIFIDLFQLVLSGISDEHNEKTRIVMCDLLSPLLLDSPSISFELLDVILLHLLEPQKSSRKMAYQLATELVVRCSEALEGNIESLLNSLIVGNPENKSLSVSHRLYDLIYELHCICPGIMHTVLPQLEHKLKSLEDEDRKNAVNLLAKIFSGKNSQVKAISNPLWQAFLGRFNDISVEIRKICVQHSMHFLLNHPETRKDIEINLCRRLHDADERVRLEVVKAVLFTATNGGFEYVTGNQQLMDCLKERTLDKKSKIRHQALQGLAEIYQMYLGRKEASLEAPPAWIHNRILQGYYLSDAEDRILIEKLLSTCVVPYTLDVKERMVQLMYVCSTTNENTYKAFIETQKQLILVRRQIVDLLKIVGSTSTDKKERLNSRISALSKFVANPVYGSEFIPNLVRDMEKDRSLYNGINLIVTPTSDCKTVVDNVNGVLKKLGPPTMTNVYCGTIKSLIERASSVLIDKEAVLVLLKLVSDLVQSEDSSQNDIIFRSKEFPAPDVIIEKSCNLIAALAFLHTAHFDNREALKSLINLLLCEDLRNLPSSTILSALVTIGKEQRAIDRHQPALMELLKDFCLSMVDVGTPRQAKMAIRCLNVNLTDDTDKKEAFSRMLETITANLENPLITAYATAVVALGHVALLMPNEFRSSIKSLIRERIVKGLLMNPTRTLHDSTMNMNKDWCDENALPHVTCCMVYGMKTVARWLVGLETDADSAKKTFKMLTAFVETGGAFLEKDTGSPFSNSEKAWLRLSAGCSQLKIVQQKGVGDQYNAAQYCSLAQLMNDDVEQVRIRFAGKLHKGLNKGVPHKCLPLDFLGFYALGGFETNKKIRATLKQYVQADVKVRREYINMLMLSHPDKEQATEQLPYLMPDYMFAFAVAVLANNPHFKSHRNLDELNDVQRCLEFILEPLVVKSDSYSFAFYRKLIQGIKNKTNAADPDDEESNSRMYAICDIASELLVQHDRFPIQNTSTPVEPKIPSMYFARHVNEDWCNSSSYLLEDFLTASKRRRGLRSPGRAPTPRTPAAKSAKNPGGTPRGSKRARNQEPEEEVVATIDAIPTDPKRTRIESEGLSGNSEGSVNHSERNDSLDSAGGASGGNGGLQQKNVGGQGKLMHENVSESHDEEEDEDEENECPALTSPKPSTSHAAREGMRPIKRPPTPSASVVSKRKRAVTSAKPKIMLRSKNKT